AAAPMITRWRAFSRRRLPSRWATSLSSATRTVRVLAVLSWPTAVPPAFASGMPELLQGLGALGGQRDREVERRAVADRALHPDLASVHLHDLLNDREAQASPGN